MQFKCVDDLMDHIMWYHKTCTECVKHGVMCALCRQEKRIWQQRTDAKKRFQVHARRIMEITAKKIKIFKPGDNVMVSVPDLDRAKINAQSLHIVIVEEFKLGTRYILPLVWNKI